MATSFETRQTDLLKQRVEGEVRAEYAKHYEAIAKHPRLLIGTQVPSLTGEGMETLRDSSDAKDWQDAVRNLLDDMVNSQVETRKDGMRDVFTTIHSSIDLFRNNTDLIPGTKGFNRKLADTVAPQLKDYELKANGKLIGYSVPVQPIINAVRAQLAATAAPVAAAPVVEQPRAADGRWDAPQAGITSKAGQSSSGGSGEAAGVMDAFFRQNGLQL